MQILHFSELERVKICILANFSYSNTLYIKYFSYICTIKQNKGRDSTLAQVIIGVRRSGKSTLCHKVLLEHQVKYGYANFDDDRLAKLRVEDLNTVLSCIYQIYGTDIKYIFLDEVQDVEGWHLFVNRLLRTNLHVVVTGSNAKLLSGELATHLTGRYNEIHLFPFSFREYCNYHQLDTKGITTKDVADIKRAFMEYITIGGFPEIQSIRNKRGYVQSLLEAIITKDIQQRFNIRGIRMPCARLPTI